MNDLSSLVEQLPAVQHVRVGALEAVVEVRAALVQQAAALRPP